MRLRSMVPSREPNALMPPGFGLFGLHREIDRLFNEFAQGVGPDGAKNIVPSIEISETDKAIEISAEMPGLERKEHAHHPRREYDLNPARCQRITVSGRTIASAPYILGNSRQTPPNINLSIETNRSLLGLARRSTLICCLSTRISASSATCDRNRSLAIPKISRHKFSIGYQHRAILSQLPARLNLRQGQLAFDTAVAPAGCRSGPSRASRKHRTIPAPCELGQPTDALPACALAALRNW
jgi:hypothetical protein